MSLLLKIAGTIIISYLLLSLLYYLVSSSSFSRYFAEDIYNLTAVGKEEAVQLIKTCQVVSGTIVDQATSLNLANGKSIHTKLKDLPEISEAMQNRPEKCGPPLYFYSPVE